MQAISFSTIFYCYISVIYNLYSSTWYSCRVVETGNVFVLFLLLHLSHCSCRCSWSIYVPCIKLYPLLRIYLTMPLWLYCSTCVRLYVEFEWTFSQKFTYTVKLPSNKFINCRDRHWVEILSNLFFFPIGDISITSFIFYSVWGMLVHLIIVVPYIMLQWKFIPWFQSYIIALFSCHYMQKIFIDETLMLKTVHFF